MSSDVATAVVLERDDVRAEILPAQGGRVRSLRDRIQERELLYVRPDAAWEPDDYLATLAGGWDQMFPNDDPWRGLPTHGVLWSADFGSDLVADDEVVLRCELDRPAATVSHRYRLLAPPRRGLRLETVVEPREALAECLWATHPMLAVAPGWRIDAGKCVLEADRVDPGRAAPGALDDDARARVLVLPTASQGWQEVLYAPATGEATVTSADRAQRTIVRWDAAFFRWLWIVTLSGFEGVDLALVLEPCTSRPYRLDEAVAEGTAQALVRGQTYRFWSSVEAAP
jgi:hypothetical protein